MNRFVLAVLVGLWGGAEILGGALSRSETATDLPEVFAAAFVGAAFSGAIVAPLLLRRHIAWYIFACILVTTLGGVLGGIFLATAQNVPLFFGIGLGAVAPWIYMQQSVFALFAWLIGATLLRLAIRRYSLK